MKSILVRIGHEERKLDDVEESWIAKTIARARQAGQRICAMVTVNCSQVNMVLATPACAGTGGGGRSPNPLECEIFELWKKRGLNQADFTPGNLIAFLKQLVRML